MMRLWSHRPQFLHLALFFAAYVLGCGFAKVLGIAPGTNISIWPPGGLFMATLIVAPPPTWPWWMLVGCPAELLSQLLWWHSPLPAGFLMYVGNALEAVAGAWLVNRACKRPVRLETLQEVLALVVLGAGVAPVISATVGSATLAWWGIKSQSFATAWPLWWIGDATGVLLVAPPALVVLHNWRRKAQLSAAQWIEAGVLGLIFLGAAAFSLSGYSLPFAYIIMPPLLWAAVRFEFKGVAVALTLLALITVVFTLSGASQLAGDADAQRQKHVVLQLFLAISAFSALIVAAISRQYQQALLTLRDRERELSQLVDMVPSHLWRLAPDGEPIFFSKRMADFLGLDVADTDKPGMSRLEAVIATVHPDDAAGFRDALNRCLLTGESFALRYRLRRADGAYRWMSSRAEPMRDQEGRIVQWYGLCHDIDDQMHAEEALRAAQDKLARAMQAASLSELSASIAHEVNQPLAAIVATSHACSRWLSADPPNLERAKATLDRITRDANSASEVVSRIRALFGQMGRARSPAGMAEVIDEVCRLMANELAARNVAVETEVGPSLPPALIDRVQLQQVLVNLIRNAADASDTAAGGARQIWIRALLDGDNEIRVEVRDLGAGIKEPERVFEPFFTTKEDGMGMGLAICRSIIEAHDGRLWAADNQPRGSTLVFTLPVQARNAA